MSEIRRHLAYLRYVARHKWHVFRACRELEVPLLQSLLHDASKFLPSEWTAYARTFYNEDGTKKPYDETPEFAYAWLHHQRRNPHHWQYWVLESELLPMPLHFAREMVADWIGAGLAITGRREVVEWYQKHKDKMRLHPDTRELVELLVRRCS